ncbi:MAG: diguanylate cyclase [Gemmatimonadota bacterium]|nr:diguanylate cyclase [Gemmatimonadota bacterium]
MPTGTRQLEQRITALQAELEETRRQNEILSAAHDDLLNLEEIPLLFLDQQYHLLDYTSAFSDLVGNIEDYRGEPVSRLLRETSWGPVEQALEQRQKILNEKFSGKGRWKQCYKGPRKGERIGTEWFVFPGSGTWSLAPGEVKLVSERSESSSYLTLAQPVGGAEEDLRISFTIHTPADTESIRDLSAVLSGTDGADGRWPDSEGYFFGIGSAGNRRLEIQKKEKTITKHFLSLEPDRDYRVKLLRLGGHLELRLDGKLMLSVTDINPLYGMGHEFFSLYTFGSEAVFRDITIETRPATHSRDYFCLAERFEVELDALRGSFFELSLNEGRLPETHEPVIRVYFKDITEQKVLQQDLKVSQERLADLVETLPMGVLQMTTSGELLFVNRYIARLFGYSSPEKLVKRQNFEVFFWDREKKYELMEKLFREGRVAHFSFTGITLDNRKIWLEADLELVTDAAGQDNGQFIQGVLMDITERKRLEDELIRSSQRLKQMTIMDEQTRACNSLYFRRLLDEELDRVNRYGHPLTLLLMDVDSFKKINDRLGRKRGDRILRQLVDFISNTLRTPDCLARWGGTEFILLLPETGSREGLLVAERLCRGIAGHKFEIEGMEVALTVSIGMVTASVRTEAETMLRQVDDVLHKAKKEGRNRVVVFETEHSGTD